MTAYVALLRAINVGGTGKLPMTELKALCQAAGFTAVKTYIASGNVVFLCSDTELRVKAALEKKLAAAGCPTTACVRSAREMADVVARNPFADKPGNRVVALTFDGALPATALTGATGRNNEDVRLGKRELYIFYPDGQGVSRLSLPAQKIGTARDMNTIAKLAEMAAALG